MEIAAIIDKLDHDIIEARSRVLQLDSQLREETARMNSMILERDALQSAAQRYGGEGLPVAEDTAAENWSHLSRVDAVERVLRECERPMHLSAIEDVLRAHWRAGDTVTLISATLAHLKRSKGTVATLGGGNWEYREVDPLERMIDELGSTTRGRLAGGLNLPTPAEWELEDGPDEGEDAPG